MAFMSKLIFDHNNLELALIDIDYGAADISHCDACATDASERVNLAALLQKILMAKAAMRIALEAMKISHNRAEFSRAA